MTLEERLVRRKPIVITKRPSNEALEQVRSGSKFVIVEDDFPDSSVPDGYTLIRMKFKGDTFKTLIPQNLLFFMANPGEGDPENGLEEIADFYGEAKDYEDEVMGNGDTHVQGANWASLARNSYSTYLVNRLVANGNGDDSPEFSEEVLRALDIADPYVSQRVRAIAALALGTDIRKVKKSDIRTILKRVTVETAPAVEKISKDEFRKITQMRYKPRWDMNRKDMRCLADSHYYLKDEYKNDSEWDYDLRTMKKTRKGPSETKVDVFDSSINKLESEITAYRAKKRGAVGRHDPALIRQYINLAHIAQQNPRAQLDVSPPENGKDRKEEKK